MLAWRDVPVTADLVGEAARRCMPWFAQVVVSGAADRAPVSGLDLERRSWVLRKRAEHEARRLLPVAVGAHARLQGHADHRPGSSRSSPTCPTAGSPPSLAIVHSRFSTNTFPSWPLAHPFRMIAHNGEINTVKGNRNWMAARESLLSSELLAGGDLERVLPICSDDASDSASFDEVLELLHLAGRPLPHAVLMMIPEAWENHTEMDPARRAFYEFHSALMEPWDGPACVTFTDGTLVGAVLDRNGLRPGRYWVTDDGLVVLASEVGVLDLDPATVVRKGRLQPGRMFLVDTEHGRLVDDDEIKSQAAAEHPYADWLHAGVIEPEGPARARARRAHPGVRRAAPADLRLHRGGACACWSRRWRAPVRSRSGRWAPTRPSRCCRRAPGCSSTTSRRLFAQVTNPPLDAIREEARHLARHLHGARGSTCSRPRRPTCACCRCRSR
ncbi:hypothetical protein GCM10025868_03120 [Angustibacter aerolatus]|uniref:Glutamine amidotransferase type-2 domain-containing protein n=1 Tax=Angustibacter aerolatus TaxID=1162965 RepID=A0ABQ6JA47_9ACTN|nr:hypothetical protein GCM10025868_03120 [Angustibacter aerolatus]